MRNLTVLIAEDYAPLRATIANLLASAYQVEAAVSDGHALLTEAKRLRPDFILLDISLPVLNGLQAARQLTRSAPDSKLVFLTQHGSPEYLQAAFRARARAYVLKESIQSDLLPALAEAARGRYYISPRLLRPEWKSAFNPDNNPSEILGQGLNAVQLDILRALQKGRTEEQIATDLHVAVDRIYSEIEDLSLDWNAETRAELINFGISTGLLAQERV